MKIYTGNELIIKLGQYIDLLKDFFISLDVPQQDYSKVLQKLAQAFKTAGNCIGQPFYWSLCDIVDYDNWLELFYETCINYYGCWKLCPHAQEVEPCNNPLVPLAKEFLSEVPFQLGEMLHDAFINMNIRATRPTGEKLLKRIEQTLKSDVLVLLFVYVRSLDLLPGKIFTGRYGVVTCPDDRIVMSYRTTTTNGKRMLFVLYSIGILDTIIWQVLKSEKRQLQYFYLLTYVANLLQAWFGELSLAYRELVVTTPEGEEIPLDFTVLTLHFTHLQIKSPLWKKVMDTVLDIVFNVRDCTIPYHYLVQNVYLPKMPKLQQLLAQLEETIRKTVNTAPTSIHDERDVLTIHEF